MNKLLAPLLILVIAGATFASFVGIFYAGSSYAQPAITAGSGSGSAPAIVESTEPKPLPPAPSPDMVTKSWRGGAFVSAGILALYMLLLFAGKYVSRISSRVAFYVTAATVGVAMLVDSAAHGTTPTLGMFVAALSTIAAIITKAPEKTTAGQTASSTGS